MNNQGLVHLLELVLPADAFTALRRRIPLCKYNFHSAVRIRPATRDDGMDGLYATCKHCGVLVERDHKRQWRRVPVAIYAGNPDQAAPADQPAIPLVAHESGAYVIEQGQRAMAED